jgi:hypothetical protein
LQANLLLRASSFCIRQFVSSWLHDLSAASSYATLLFPFPFQREISSYHPLLFSLLDVQQSLLFTFQDKAVSFYLLLLALGYNSPAVFFASQVKSFPC